MGHAITGMFGGSSRSEPVEQAQPAHMQQPQQTYQAPACELDSKAFLNCLERSNNDIGACQVC